jgi:hypothetical protein
MVLTTWNVAITRDHVDGEYIAATAERAEAVTENTLRRQEGRGGHKKLYGPPPLSG